MAIAGELHFEVPRPLDQLLDQHPVVAEGAHRFAPRQVELGKEIGQVVDAAHALATTAGARFDQQRCADGPGLLQQVLRSLFVAVIAGHARHLGPYRDALGLDLRSHALDHFGTRPDPLDAVLDTAFDELGTLRQEAVAGVNRRRAAGQGSLDDRLRVQVAARGFRRADANRSIGLADMTGVDVGVGVNGDRADAEPAAGSGDPAGDLAAVGDQDGLEHGLHPENG